MCDIEKEVQEIFDENKEKHEYLVSNEYGKQLETSVIHQSKIGNLFLQMFKDYTLEEIYIRIASLLRRIPEASDILLLTDNRSGDKRTLSKRQLLRRADIVNRKFKEGK